MASSMMLLMESRIRGNVYVRFGGRHWETYRRKAARRLMSSLQKLSDEEKKEYNVYPKLNVYNVFNVAQTNLEQARPELYAKLEEQNRLKRPGIP